MRCNRCVAGKYCQDGDQLDIGCTSCQVCGACISGFYQTSNCTVADTQCALCSVCNSFPFEVLESECQCRDASSPCTPAANRDAWRNRVCASSCAQCAPGTYESTPCAAGGQQTVCTACSPSFCDYNSGLYEAVPCEPGY